jgi:hypothetical protein
MKMSQGSPHAKEDARQHALTENLGDLRQVHVRILQQGIFEARQEGNIFK